MPVFRTRDFKLTSGAALDELEIAYECYGRLAAGRANVILVTHGITSSHYAAGAIAPDRRTGWWSEVIGPGALFDTDRFCIVSSNVLGSCYGSTGPASTDPSTGQPYGPRFPAISYEDIVNAQHMLLLSLGVERVMAVAGASIGGYQAFQWAVSFPDFIKGLIVTDTAPKDLFDSDSAADRLVADLASDPHWNGGDYYRSGGMQDKLTAIRMDILKSYGFEEKTGLTDADARQAMLESTARAWAREFDANSLIAMRRAMARFNVEDDLGKIRARVFYVLADTDEWFPASIGREVMARLERAGVDATFHEVKSLLGHYATVEEPEKWVPQARRFLAGLESG